MKLVPGKPQWKRKPKTSALDTDIEYVKLRNMILGGKFKPFEQYTLILNEAEDGKRLGVKHPWRYVRDNVRRLIKEAGVESDYSVVCRQTTVPGEWGVHVSYEPPNLAAAHGDSRKVNQMTMTRAEA